MQGRRGRSVDRCGAWDLGRPLALIGCDDRVAVVNQPVADAGRVARRSCAGRQSRFVD
jgi:hypothetical protein